MTRPSLINAGIYLYRDHYLIKRRDCRAWDILPMDTDGITRHKAKSREDCVRAVNSFHKCEKRNKQKQKGLF